MSSSVSMSKTSAELAQLEDWERFKNLSNEFRIARLQSFRDPLKSINIGNKNIVAVFGFHVGNMMSQVVYYWHISLSSIRWRHNKLRHNKPIIDCIEFGQMVAEFVPQKPEDIQFNDFFNKDLFGGLPNSKNLLENYNLHWGRPHKRTKNDRNEDTQIIFACLYQAHSNLIDLDTVKSVPQFLNFHEDYFFLRSPIWKSLPTPILLEKSQEKVEDLVRVHLHPKTFNPLEPADGEQFLWPWQHCFKLNENDAFEYSAIKTISLVFDLRNSTVAMEQLPKGKLGEYSPFLSSTIERAKTIVMQHGGFFDKETGDGIVAHFIDILHVKNSQKRAYDAAAQIIKEVSIICDKFQDGLIFEIGNLAPSVGIHEGMSVWVAEDSQIRAVGESVVTASRLADETDPKAIFVSNSFFRSLEGHLPIDVKIKFEKKPYSGKEYKGDPNLYGYQIKF